MKKGFTLIELLAVIVILAIIALIATPIILGIIEDARSEAKQRSAELYLTAVEQAILRKKMNGDVSFNPSYCVIEENNVLSCDSGSTAIDVDAEDITTGYIKINNGKVEESNLEATDESCFEVGEDNLGLYIDGYICEASDVVIPSTIGGKTVVVIGDDAFFNKGLTSVVIPNSVVIIGEMAFASNPIKHVVIPSSVTRIDYMAFFDNVGRESITIKNTQENVDTNSDAFSQDYCGDITDENCIDWNDIIWQP